MPVEQLRLGTQQDSFRKRSRTCAEVIGSFAHIHSRSDLVGHAINQQELHRMAKRQSVLCTPAWRLKNQSFATRYSPNTYNKGANLHPPPVCPLIPAVLLRQRQPLAAARRQRHPGWPRPRAQRHLRVLHLPLPKAPVPAQARPAFHRWPV